MDIDVREWAQDEGAITELREGRVPVVYAFRPTKILTVKPEKLDDWEKLFTENVGLRPPDRELAARQWTGDPKQTISGSNDGWDDCDYW